VRSFLVAALLVLFTTATYAQALPGSADLQFDPAQGGWVDWEAGLVWGVEATSLSPYILSYSWLSSNNWARDYPLSLWGAGNNATADGDRQQAAADAYYAAGEIGWGDYYQAQANASYANADASYAMAELTVLHTGWRMPTLEEVQIGWAKGLFTFPRNARLDPTAGSWYQIARWISPTLRGGKQAYRFYGLTGVAQIVPLDTIAEVPIVVRSLYPDDGGDDGGGNGNGKGKNK
jgi:hypothetical protein